MAVSAHNDAMPSRRPMAARSRDMPSLALLVAGVCM
jgi:hypothetical protein